MIGLSTRGSISLGWALVAGRNLVPQPAAGKTALRTRIEPRDSMELGGERGVASLPPASWPARSVGLGKRAHEPPDGFRERLRAIEIREVRGAAQAHPAGIASGFGERPGR